MVFYFFRRYLFSRQASSTVRIISWICLGGVSLGVVAMIFVMSVMNGFGDAIHNRLLTVEAHLVVKEPTDETPQVRYQKMNDLQKSLLEKPEISEATPYERQDVILRTIDGLYGGAIARGMAPEVLHTMLQKTILDRFKNEGEKEDLEPKASDALGERDVFIGVDLAHSLGVIEGDELVVVPPESLLLPVGEIPKYDKVKVKAVVRTNIADQDSQMMFYERGKALRHLMDSSSIETGIEIRLKNPEQVEQVQEELKAQGRLVETWRERNSALFYSLKMEKFLMGLFLGVTLFISSFSIVIVLFLLATQKRQDIGILMAMGLSARRSQRLFAGLGALLSGIGLIFGMLLGLGLCLLWERFPFIRLPDIYYDTRIPIRVDPGMIAIIILLGFAIALFTAWLPARKTSRLSPVDALRPGETK